MEYKINKLQNGGGYATFTPITRNYPGSQNTNVASSSDKSDKSSSDEESNSILSKKMMDDLYSGGLVNDVHKFVNELIQLEQSSDLPFMKPNNRIAALRMRDKFNEIKETKDYWSKAIATAKENGGLSEVAVDGGRIFTKTEDNKIQSMSLKEYEGKRDKVSPLSVQELMYERQYNSSLTGQNGVFIVAENAIGMNKITEHIQSLVAALGTETDKDSHYYSKEQAAQTLKSFGGKQPSKEEYNALMALNEVIKGDSQYAKVSLETSSKKNQITTALNYIWNTLGTPAQEKLSATAVINGVSNPKQFIYDVLNTNTPISVSREVTPVETTDAQGLPKTPKEETNTRSLTQFQMLHNDKLANPNTTFAYNDPIMSTLFRGFVGGVSPIILPNGDNVGMTTINTILNKGYNAFLKGTDTFFGDKKVSLADTNNIIYDGQDAAKVYMPVGTDGGPDYDAFAKFKEIYAVYEANKSIWSPKQAENHFKQNGYNLKIDEQYEDGQKVKIIRDNAFVKPFLVMYGYTNNATDLVKGNENWLTKLSSDEESSLLPQFKNVWTIGTGKTAQNVTPNSFGPESYYKGMVAIPYKPEAAAIINAMVGQGPKEKIASIGDVQRNLYHSSNQPLNPNTSGLSLNPQ